MEPLGYDPIVSPSQDVSSGKESFGPGGPYAAFAGHDATYNLAVMTLKKQTVDTFAARRAPRVGTKNAFQKKNAEVSMGR